MRKKKQNKIYKQGMKDGAAPFEKKYEETTKQIKKTTGHLDEIARNQRKSEKIMRSVIDGMQDEIRETEGLKEDSRKIKDSVRKQKEKIANLELMMPAVSTLCGACGTPITTHQIVCSNCGAISKVFPYELQDFDISDRCIEGVKELSETIKENNSPDEDWFYPELEGKLVRMKKIRSIARKVYEERGENAAVYKKIYNLSQKFFEDYRKQRIEIAVVGTVKAGKSSLINSLIGIKLASVDPTPETSILVKYRTTASGNYLNIKFYTVNQWDKLWSSAKDATVFRSEYERLEAEVIKYEYLNHKDIYIECSEEELQELMMEWSKSDSPKHFFVKEIEVGYRSNTIPHDVFLVDTPGLSDPVRYRSDITRKYIKNSDWILACIVGENLSQQPEFNFLSKVIANKGGDVSKIFVVATKKDMLTNSEGEKKAEEFLIRLGELYKNNSMAISRFTFVAAECHLLTQRVINGDELNDEEYEKLSTALVRIRLSYSDINSKSDVILKYAGVMDLFNKIDTVVLKDRRNYILNAILDDYLHCMRVINENSAMYIEDSREYLQKLTSDREFDQEQIAALKENNKELAILQRSVQELRDNLEIEISVYEGKKETKTRKNNRG